MRPLACQGRPRGKIHIMYSKTRLIFAASCTATLCLPCLCFAQAPATAPATPPAITITIPVDSPAFAFSPGNWVGDTGRGGAVYRQTWNSGAYFRVAWSTTSTTPTASILIDPSEAAVPVKARPNLAYNIDGVWTDNVPCADTIPITGLTGAGRHLLTVYQESSAQMNRWGAPGTSATNVTRIAGLQVDANSTPGVADHANKWAFIIGDSITEGIGTNGHLGDYAYFVGEALQTQGYEYGVSACGFSGWLRKGDGTGDVPGYYIVSGSTDGKGGKYDESLSRWDKIDGNNHSLLDANGHISGWGGTGQEPTIITINYGTNDTRQPTGSSDVQASITGSLTALRAAAPNAKIFLIIPFGQFCIQTIHAGVDAYEAAHPADKNVFIIDLGPSVAKTLNSNNFLGNLHPNLRGHAVFATGILAGIESHLGAG